MIKLITQFDNEKSKLSLATPTCGCCSCCCCCCVISTFATTSISARNFGNYVAKTLPDEPKKIRAARRFGFWFPFGLLASLGLGLWLVKMMNLNIFILIPIGILYLFIMALFLNKKINPSKTSGKLIFLFPVGLLVSVGLGLWLVEIMKINIFIVLIAIGILYLCVMVRFLNKELSLSGIISRMIFFTVLLGIFEIVGFYGGMIAFVYLTHFYLFAAVAIPILLIAWAFGKKYDVKNSEDIINNSSSNEQNSESVSNIETMEINTDNLLDKEKLTSDKSHLKKKCSHCGIENDVDNKKCIYCSNLFETDDKK